MKLYHPDQTVTSCSFEGEAFNRQKDGGFEVPAEAVAALLPHGFTTTRPEGLPDNGAGDEDDDPSQFMVQLAKKNKAEIAAYLLEAYQIEVDPDKNRKDDLLDMVVEAAAKAADAARLAELQAKAPEELTPEEADELAALQPQDEGQE